MSRNNLLIIIIEPENFNKFGTHSHNFSCTLSKSAQTATVSFSPNKLVLTYNPLRVDVYAGEELVASVNARGLFHVETQLLKP